MDKKINVKFTGGREGMSVSFRERFSIQQQPSGRLRSEIVYIVFGSWLAGGACSGKHS